MAEVTERDLLLLKAINNSRRQGILQPPNLRDEAKELLLRGLVAEDPEGMYVPDDVKFQLLADGRSLGR